MNDRLSFQTRKMTITIDYRQCIPARENNASPSCGFACVKACRLYGRNILRIEGNRPVLAVSDQEEIKRLDNECISCEYNCGRFGPGCITIDIPLD
jgi:predicted molibdopterin-dependent oxidoreductase YjgC